MRNISVAMTKEQILQQIKWVTRRFGWDFLQPGDPLQPVEKAQGLKKGEKVKKLGPPIRVLRIDTLPAGVVSQKDCRLEGFPDMTPEEFTEMLCKANNKNHPTW